MNPYQSSDYTQDTYRTGSTRPPKKREGVVAFILVLVIFLCGVSTVLNFFHIQLPAPPLTIEPETTPLTFTRNHSQQQTEDIAFLLGFSGQEVPELWCLYQDLPQGIYITDVADQAALQGVLPGDILLSVDGQNITSTEQLRALLDTCQKPSAQVILYRGGEQIETTLTMLSD